MVIGMMLHDVVSIDSVKLTNVGDEYSTLEIHFTDSNDKVSDITLFSAGKTFDNIDVEKWHRKILRLVKGYKMVATMTESEKRLLDQYNQVKRELHTCTPCKKGELKKQFDSLYTYLHAKGVL